MKLFTANQIRQADAYTIEHEPISSVELMERAATQCVKWFTEHFDISTSFTIFCGTGNNGGDGLVIARQLLQKGYVVSVYIVEFSKKYSPDFSINLDRLQKLNNAEIHFLTEENHSFKQNNKSIIIDAIFGTGLSRPVSGFVKKIITTINKLNQIIISIDMPSGLFAEDNSKNDKDAIIKADEVLTFEFPKIAFLLPENQAFVHHFTILPIGIHSDFIRKTSTNYFFTDEIMLKSIYKLRPVFSHKGTFGHSLLLVSKYGMAGAGYFSAKSCVVSGSGLTTIHCPEKNAVIFQTQLPEATLSIDQNPNFITEIPKNIQKYSAIAVGPGIGLEKQTQNALKLLIQETNAPLIIDADAITILSENKTWLSFLPSDCIFTPHPKELERLIGKWHSDTEKLEKTKDFALKYNCYIIIKGAFSVVACPDGNYYFNPTGNPGMATGGSGDVLTGIICGLTAQGYSSKDAAILGTYLHGLAADSALTKHTFETITASVIIDFLPQAFKKIAGNS